MKLERIRWKRTKGSQHLLLDKVYDAVTEEFTGDAMASLATVLKPYAKCFGSFRLLPDQRLLKEGDKPVRIGSRALDLLIALVDRPGELVRKEELVARVWPNTNVAPCNLSVHIAALRRILGDGRDGKRFVINIPGRGYRFVADVTTDIEPSPPLAVDATHNLPTPFIQLVGREGAMADLLLQLKQQRLLTVVGPGGVGKSSVAQAVARELMGRFRDGTWLIDLEPLADPQRLPSALRSALGFETHEEASIQRVIASLRDKSMLLLLDNCAHLVSAAARLADAVLKDAPGVQVLATSCEPLGILGEQVYRLPPLECPPGSAQLTADAVLRFPAVRLFVERAYNLRGEFELSNTDALLVASICRRLDGIPLAIKSAAAGVSFLGLQGLSENLDDSLGLTTNFSRSASQRQHSMRATLDWSYSLLTEPQRLALRRLSNFPGEFTLSAAGAVKLCTLAETAASHRAVSPRANESPTDSSPIVSALIRAADERDLGLARARLQESMAAFDRGEELPKPKIACALWSDPVPAVLTGIRSALAVAITSTFWFATAWPDGPIAVIVAAVVCSLLASLEQPDKISMALAATVLLAAVPVFATQFYLMPLAIDFPSMAVVLAPLMLPYGYIMAQPRIGPLGLLSAVYFAFASNIDNVMTYDAAAFLNSSLAVLVGIAVAVVLFATFFPETPAFAVRRFRRQLSVHLGHLVDASRCASALSCYQSALCEQLGTTLARVKDEPKAAHECLTIALAALSAAQAVNRLKSSLDGTMVAPEIGAEGSRLLARLSQTLRNPSVWKFGRRAAEARALSRHALAIARNSAELEATEVLAGVVVGSATLVSDLMSARIILQGKSNAIPI